MSQTLHVEISRNPSSAVKVSELRRLLKEAVESLKNPVLEFSLKDPKNAQIKQYVNCIKFCSSVVTYKIVRAESPDEVIYSKYNEIKNHEEIEYHVFKLNEEGETVEFLDEDDTEAQSPSWYQWLLPSQAFHDLWESLIFESDVKSQLIDYVKTVFLYSDKKVDESLIPWNKVILLHGPPGTGKTSLCKALAQKATIRLGSRFNYGQLIEINSHSLFTKFSSESAKIILKVFDKIQEMIEDPHSIVFLFIDEVESLVCKRPVDKFDSESAFAVRTVNAILTQIDRIKKYPNVIILTTSNLVASVDEAFLDRADLKLCVGNPSVDCIYEILATSINELVRVDIVRPGDRSFLPRNAVDSHRSSYGERLMEIARSSDRLGGRVLRKIPFLTHVNYIKGENCSLSHFLESMELALSKEMENRATLDLKLGPRLKKDPDYVPDDDCEVIDVDTFGERKLRNSKQTRRGRGRPGRRKANSNISPPPLCSTRGSIDVRVKIEGETRTRSARLQEDAKSEDGVILTRNRLRHSEVSECIEVEPCSSVKSQSTKAKRFTTVDVRAEVTDESGSLGEAGKVNTRRYRLKPGVKLKPCFVDLSQSIVSTKLVREFLRRQCLNGMEPSKRKLSPSSNRATSVDSRSSPCKILKTGDSASSRTEREISDLTSRSGSQSKDEKSRSPLPSSSKASPVQIKKEDRRKSMSELSRSSKNDHSVSVQNGLAQMRPQERPKSQLPLPQDAGLSKSSAKDKRLHVVESSIALIRNAQKAVDRALSSPKTKTKVTAQENSSSVRTNSGLHSTKDIIILDGPDSIKKDIKHVGAMKETSGQNVMLMTQTMDGKVVSINGKQTSKAIKGPQYNCDQCDFSFYLKRELNHHYATHLDPVSLSCQQCHRTFTKADYRKKHELKCMLKGDSPPERPRPMPLSVKKSRGHPVKDVSKLEVRVPSITSSSPAVTSGSDVGNAEIADVVKNAVKSLPAAPIAVVVNNMPDISGSVSSTTLEKSSSGNSIRSSVTEKLGEPGSIDSDEGYYSGLQPLGDLASPTENRLYVCALCPKSFKREATLAYHVRTVHEDNGDEEQQYPCTVCGTVFDSEEEVSKHEARDHNPSSTGSSSYVPASSVESSIPPDTPTSQTTPDTSSSNPESNTVNLITLQSGPAAVPPKLANLSSYDKEYDSFRSNNSLEPMDFQLDYHHCDVCGECFFNDFELTQHLQTVHASVSTSTVAAQPQPTVTEPSLLMQDNLAIPVPDAESVIEVETTDEFLSFLSAF